MTSIDITNRHDVAELTRITEQLRPSTAHANALEESEASGECQSLARLGEFAYT